MFNFILMWSNKNGHWLNLAIMSIFMLSMPPICYGVEDEIEPNDTRQTAVALTLVEDPSGGGYWVGCGQGSVTPAADVDWWRFEALAGDLVSVAVDTPDSDVYPYVYLYNAAGGWQTGDSDGNGPGSDAFISRYVIPASGTYYVQVSKTSWSSTGAYQLRVDVARGVELEADRNFANDSTGGANVLALHTSGRGRSATVAGTVMEPISQVDMDCYKLGMVRAGESVLVSLRLPASSSLVRPVVEIRDTNGNTLSAVTSPIEMAAQAHISVSGIYYAVVGTMEGAGTRGQYLMDVSVWPTASLAFPDLVVSELTVPAATSSGQKLRISWTVSNAGTGSTHFNNWLDRVIFSPNDRYGDADDIEMARVPYAGVLEAGGHYNA